MRVDRWRLGAAGIAMVLLVAGCAGTASAPAPTKAVAVNDPAAIAGKWTGVMELEGSGDRDDFIELTVDRNATYRVTSSRTIGLLDAQGTLAVADGKLQLAGPRGGRGTGTLYEGATPADRALVLVGATPSGRRFSVRLRPASAP